MISAIKHLLPNAKAWRITTEKSLTKFFRGLAEVFQSSKNDLDSVLDDVDPQTTTKLTEYENAFALRDTGLTEQQRRDRLAGEWKAFGGQDPHYIQSTLKAAGFDVFIHEWWETDTNPPVARNPFLYLWDGAAPRQSIMAAGHDSAVCGGDLAFCSSQTSPLGYPLVNKVLESYQAPIGCGSDFMICGSVYANAGRSITSYRRKQYIMPADPTKHPYFLYIGGESFPNHASVPLSRKEEFEDLCLKICPNEQWLGMLITYS